MNGSLHNFGKSFDGALAGEYESAVGRGKSGKVGAEGGEGGGDEGVSEDRDEYWGRSEGGGGRRGSKEGKVSVGFGEGFQKEDGDWCMSVYINVLLSCGWARTGLSLGGGCHRSIIVARVTLRIVELLVFFAHAL